MAKGGEMALPTMVVGGESTRPRTIILLSGFDRKAHVANARGSHGTTKPVEVFAKEELLKSVKRNHDAVAFGFVGGKWIPSA